MPTHGNGSTYGCHVEAVGDEVFRVFKIWREALSDEKRPFSSLDGVVMARLSRIRRVKRERFLCSSKLVLTAAHVALVEASLRKLVWPLEWKSFFVSESTHPP